MFHENKNKKEETFLFNNSLYANYITLSRKNPCINECIQFIVNTITTRIVITNGNPVFSSYFEQHILPFLRQVLKTVLLIGWAPFAIKKLEDDVYIPFMIPLQHYRIELTNNIDTNVSKFHFYSMDDKEKKNIHVILLHDIIEFQNENLIYSILDGIYDDILNLERLKRCDIHAHIIRSNPTLILQPSKTLDENETSIMINRSFVFNSHEVMNEANRMSELMQMAPFDMESNLDFHKNQEKLYRESFTDMFAPQYKNNLFIIPANLSLGCPPQLPQPINQLQEMETFLHTKTYKAFGLSDLDVNGQIKRNRTPDISYSGSLEMEATLMFYVSFMNRTIGFIYEKLFQVPFAGTISFESYKELLQTMEIRKKKLLEI